MNLGNEILKSIDIDVVSLVLADLKRNESKLSKFLYKKFEKKNLKIDSKKLAEERKIIFAYGKINNWWLVEDISEINQDKIDYVIPVSRWNLVGMKKC